ncbi:histidine triad nucleotide-binding protein [Candidatus Parcubacteria bacterium]|jgi:histidine triad (HIT) family protein|nr:histidine triad nucleotide-binding protein [Candidatus Parcubacteria bacterium]
MSNCLFCKIINKEQPADIIYEDEKFIAFNDIAPKAPIHILIIPKKHIQSVNHLETKDKELIGELFLLAKQIAKEQKISKTGYKLIFNVGRGGGQIIDHIHLHLLAGWTGKIPMLNI